MILLVHRGFLFDELGCLLAQELAKGLVVQEEWSADKESIGDRWCWDFVRLRNISKSTSGGIRRQ